MSVAAGIAAAAGMLALLRLAVRRDLGCVSAWADRILATRRGRSAFVVGATAVAAAALAANGAARAFSARIYGVRIFGEMHLVLACSGAILSVVLPLVLALLIVRTCPPSRDQAESEAA